MDYKLYRLPNGDDRAFVGFSLMKKYGLIFNPSDYEMVYSGHITCEPGDELEAIFYQLNMEHPKDFLEKHLYSMSVGDVVELSGDFYFCDSVGWKKVESEGFGQ